MFIQLLLTLRLLSCFELKPNEQFDICYINLEREKERNQHMINLLGASNCKFTRFNAIDGVEVLKDTKKLSEYCEVDKKDKFLDLLNYRNCSHRLMGMIGCKLSHYLNMRRIEKSRNTKPVLVLEDDVDLECDFVKQLEETLQHMPVNWDILCITEHLSADKKHKNNKFIFKVRWFIEGIFVINGWKSAEKIANLIKSKCDSTTPIDSFLGNASSRNRISVFSVQNKLAVQMRRKFQSSIPSSWPLASKPLKNSLHDFIKHKSGLNT